MQYNLASEVVTNLYGFFVLMGRLIDRVVTLRLKKEMADLPARHRNHPGDQRRHRRIPEHHDIRADKAAGAEQMQGLVHQTMVIVPMIVPTLSLQGFTETAHLKTILCWNSAGNESDGVSETPERGEQGRSASFGDKRFGVRHIRGFHKPEQ